MSSVENALRTEIARREAELESLRQALAALTGTSVGAGRSAAGRPRKAATASKRRPKTAAEKKALSEKLKAAWKRRKADAKKAEKAEAK